MSRMLKSENIDGGSSFDWIGRVGYPEDRYNVTVNWSHESHAVNYYSYWIDSQASTNADGEVFKHVDSHMEHNISYSYITDWDARFTLGVRNLTDEDPKFEKELGIETRSWDASLYSAAGRTAYASVRFQF